MIYSFHSYEIDTEQRELRLRGEQVPVQPKPFSVLVHLAEHRERMVPKAELLEKFWPSNVSDAALQTTISQLRKAVGDNRQSQSVIRTYHGRGFRFVAPLEANKAASEVDQLSTVPPLRERRLVAVLCVRLVETGTGSSNQRQALLEEAHTEAQRVVEMYRGRLLHVMVEGFTAVFGIEQSHDDGARSAIYCAKELATAPVVECLEQEGLAAAFSIKTGYLDLPDDMESTRWAPPADIERGAIELAQTASSPCEIFMCGETLDHLRDEIVSETVPGGHRLVAIPHQRTGIPALSDNHRSKFVGRGSEMAFLSAGLDGLDNGQGQAVSLSGPPGIGKTRLVSEFLAVLDKSAFQTRVLNCLPRLSNTPLAPIREMSLSLFRELPADLALDAIDTALLQALLDETAPPPPVLAGLSDHQYKKRSQTLVCHLLHTVCAERPMVIVIEDVHWIDSSSRELLDVLTQGIDRHRLLLVMTTRPIEQPPLSEAVLQLSPLNRSDSIALLRAIPEIEDFGDEDMTVLIQRAAGNPFFLEELALAVKTGSDPASVVPGAVNAVISARISGLDSHYRALLYVLAVIGPSAPLKLAAHLLEQDTAALAIDARALVRLGFLRQETDSFSFRHMMINDTAYAMLLSDDRKRLHLSTAHYLEAGTDAVKTRPETLAWHFQEAEEIARAISCWTAACRQALRRSAHSEAAAFARAGIALIAPDQEDADDRELELQLLLALALIALRGFGDAEVGIAYSRARRLCETAGSPKTGFQVNVGLWVHNWVLGRLTQSMSHAEELLKAAKGSTNPALKIQANAAAGEVLVHMGRVEAGLDHLNTGLDLIGSKPPDSIPAQNAAVACAAYAGWATSLTSNSDDFEKFVPISARLSQVIDNPFAAAIHCGLCAGAFMFAGNAPKCLEYADRAVEISREHDFAFWLGTGLVERGWALGRQGKFTKALQDIDEGIAVFEATGAGVQLANWYGIQAEILLAAGKFDDGVEAGQHALDCARRAEDLFFTPRIHATIARLHEALGASRQGSWHREQAHMLAAKFGMTTRIITL